MLLNILNEYFFPIGVEIDANRAGVNFALATFFVAGEYRDGKIFAVFVTASIADVNKISGKKWNLNY